MWNLETILRKEQPVAEKRDIADRIRLIMTLRKCGITDTNVLSAIESVPRELFVSETFQDKAYDNTPLPIECGQTISQPSVVAWMTWALEVTDRMRVLEIGTGTGYQTAVLAKLCRRVYTIERYKDLMLSAEKRLDRLAIRNVTTKVGDGSKGWKETAPFERILVTAAAVEVPKPLLDQLAVGGIMVIPVGQKPNDQVLLRIRRTETGYDTQHLMHVRFVPLVEGNQSH